MRGLLSGGVWGLVLGSVAVLTASLVNETPAGNTPPAAPQVTAPQSAEQSTPNSETPQSVAVADETSASTPVSRVVAPDSTQARIEADTTPATLPTAGGEVEAPQAPRIGDAPELVATAEEPVSPNPQSVAPQIPVAEDDLVVATAPAALPQPVIVVVEEPEVVAEELAEAIDPSDTPESVAPEAPVVSEIEVATVEEAPEATPEATVEAIAEVIEDVEVDAPSEDVTEELPTLETVIAEITREEAQESEVEEALVAPAVVADADDEISEDVIEVAPETNGPAATGDESVAETTAESETDIAIEPENVVKPAVVALIPESSPSLPSGDASVTVNRLTVGDDAAEEITITAEDTPSGADVGPATERYGMQVSNPDGKPTIAVVLVDDGSFAGAIPALAGIPFPITVVLNPSQADATEKMLAYRAAGIEVAIRADLPEGATPTDVEIYFEAAFAALPETVAVLDVGGNLANNGKAAIEQAIAAVSADGRGLVTVSRGLNTTLRTAETEGVPTGVVYRDLDSDGQDARVIRRFMDQAAFRARQESGVVLLGRVRADTISALILWGTANRARQVALVPVTTIFTDP